MATATIAMRMSTVPSQPDGADVVIVGGGIMGTSIAFFTATELDLDVVLVEADNIGSGSTGDSSAVLRHHYGDDEIYTKMAWWSHQFYRQFSEKTGEQIAHADSPLVRFASDDDSYVMDGYETLESLDIPVSLYDRDEVQERYPMFSFDEFDHAVSDDSAGYSDGADVAGGFARAAQEQGVTILTNTPVTDLTTTNGRVDGVETELGTISSENVVLAAGPWTPRLAESIGIEIPITTEREQVIILEPSEDYKNAYPELTPTTALPGGSWYMRPDFSDGILVATHHSGEQVDPDNYKNKPDEDVLLELTDKIFDVIPELSDAGIRGQYCGVYSTTPDHDFIIDETKNCYLACGFSGHGFKHGPAIGKIVADLIGHGETDFIDIDHFSLDRFSEDADGNFLSDEAI